MRAKAVIEHAKKLQSMSAAAASYSEQRKLLSETEARVRELLSLAQEKSEELKTVKVPDESKTAFNGIVSAMLMINDALGAMSAQISMSQKTVLDAIESIEMPEKEEHKAPSYSFDIKRDKTGKIESVEAKPK